VLVAKPTPVNPGVVPLTTVELKCGDVYRNIPPTSITKETPVLLFNATKKTGLGPMFLTYTTFHNVTEPKGVKLEGELFTGRFIFP